MATVGNDKSPKGVDEQMYSEVITLPVISGPIAGEDIDNTSQFRYHYFQLHITALSSDMVMRVEGTMAEAGGWFNVSDAGTDTTYDATGTYLLSTTRGLRLKKIRLRCVSGAGTLQGYYRGGN